MKGKAILGFLSLVLCASIVATVVLSGCQKQEAGNSDASIPYAEFPSSSLGASSSSEKTEDKWEHLGQSQMTVYDEDGNSMTYDVIFETRDAGDNPPVEGSTRMSRVLDAGDPSQGEETDRDEKCAMWALANVLIGITNRDGEKLKEFGVANYSEESMDAMYEALKPICSISTELVFLDAKVMNGETFMVNAVAPNYTSGAIVEKIDGVWKIPYMTGMLDPEDLETTEAESQEPEDQEESQGELESQVELESVKG